MLWLLMLLLIALAGWQLREWWGTTLPPGQVIVAPASNDAADADAPAAIASLRREQHAQAQRMSDLTSGSQASRDEVLGVGERLRLLEQSVARIASPRSQGETALRLDEAELLLTIGEQQLLLADDVGGALHAYALADSALAGSTDAAALNLRQSLAQETAALRALPPDPRANVAGLLDAFEAGLDAQPATESAPHAEHPSVFDRALGSMVEVRRAQQQDLLDPAARDAALTAVRLELTIARLAAERRDPGALHAATARIDRWLPRLYAADTLARQRAQLAAIQRVPLKIDLPTLGGTLTELRRLRQTQADAPPALIAPVPVAPASTKAAVPGKRP